MKLLLKSSSIFLVLNFIFSNGIYNSYDIPEYEYKTFKVEGTDLLDYTNQGDNSSLNIDLGTSYSFLSQKPGSNCSYGFGLDYNSYKEMDNEDATDRLNLSLDGSLEKYLGGTKGFFGYANADYDMNIGNAEMPSGFTEDDPADLFAGFGIGFGRVVNTKPVAQAYAIADAIGNTSDDTILAIASVIGAESSYVSKHKDDAEEVYYNDLAVASGNPSAAMQIRKILTSPAYNISDRSVGFSFKIGHTNNYILAEDVEDSGDLSIDAEYAKPLGLNQQLKAFFDMDIDLNDTGDGSMDYGLSYAMDHSYSWKSGAALTFENHLEGTEGGYSTSDTKLSLSTTKAILNKCTLGAELGYSMHSDGDVSDENDPDPIMDFNVRFTYWIF